MYTSLLHIITLNIETFILPVHQFMLPSWKNCASLSEIVSLLFPLPQNLMFFQWPNQVMVTWGQIGAVQWMVEDLPTKLVLAVSVHKSNFLIISHSISVTDHLEGETLMSLS